MTTLPWNGTDLKRERWTRKSPRGSGNAPKLHRYPKLRDAGRNSGEERARSLGRQTHEAFEENRRLPKWPRGGTLPARRNLNMDWLSTVTLLLSAIAIGATMMHVARKHPKQFRCSDCGIETARPHIPRLVPGTFCEDCCPVCTLGTQRHEILTEQPKSTQATVASWFLRQCPRQERFTPKHAPNNQL